MGQPAEILPLVRSYYLVILVSMVFVMLFNVLRQFTDGTTDTSTGMWALLSGNAFNIVGNFLLIYGIGPFPELGLLGAGISTLLSRILTAALLAGVILFRKRYAPTDWDFLHINSAWKAYGISTGNHFPFHSKWAWKAALLPSVP